MTGRGERGQALVEAALLIPCILVLLAGGYVAGRTASILSAAESGVFAQVVREGRRLPDVGPGITRTLVPGGEGAVLRTLPKGRSGILPSPFPSLEGRSSVRAEVRKGWREAGRIAAWEEGRFERSAEATVDCWDAAAPSGAKARRAVRAYVAARTFY